MVTLPRHVQWTPPYRAYDLADEGDRLRAYRAVLTEGTPADLLAVIGRDLLLDAWDTLLLPSATRVAWQPLIDRERERAAGH